MNEPDQTELPEDEQYTVPKPRKYPTYLLGMLAVAVTVLVAAVLALPFLSDYVTPQPVPSVTPSGSDLIGVDLNASTQSPTGNIVITYADGSTEVADLDAWSVSGFATGVGIGDTVAIEVHATASGADPKHQKVECRIQQVNDDNPDGVVVFDSRTRHGVGTVTCTWTRTE